MKVFASNDVMYMDEVRACKVHGDYRHFLRKGTTSWRCRKCQTEAVSRRRRKVKTLLVEEHGGHCVICGYDRCVGALDFHHVDSKQKSFGVGNAGMTYSLERMRDEAKKCVLLCKNCHAEVELGITLVPSRPGDGA